MQIYLILRWSGGLILTAVIAILFILSFRGTFCDRIAYRFAPVMNFE